MDPMTQIGGQAPYTTGREFRDQPMPDVFGVMDDPIYLKAFLGSARISEAHKVRVGFRRPQLMKFSTGRPPGFKPLIEPIA